MSSRGHLVVKLLPSHIEEGRVVSGWASTADIDRQGDIVEPSGMVVSLPVSLLHGHHHDQVIGSVFDAKAHAKGVRIKARIAEGTAKADEIWTLIKQEAITTFSIGFMGLDYEPLPKGGRRWKKWELGEVSVVAVPANRDARIESFTNAKALEDRRPLATYSNDATEILRKNLETAASLSEKPFLDPSLKGATKMELLAFYYASSNFMSAMKRIDKLTARANLQSTRIAELERRLGERG